MNGTYGLGRGFITWPIEGIVAYHIFDIPSKFITRAQRVREISGSLWDGEDHVLAVFWIADGQFAARGIDIPPLEAKEPRSAEASIYEQLHDDLAIIGKMPLIRLGIHSWSEPWALVWVFSPA